MGFFLDFMGSLRVSMNSILIMLGCRNRPKEAYPTEQFVENIEEFEGELQFDQQFHETLMLVREEKRMWAAIEELDNSDDSRFLALFRRAKGEEEVAAEKNEHNDYGLWTLSWNTTPRSPLDSKERKSIYNPALEERETVQAEEVSDMDEPKMRTPKKGRPLQPECDDEDDLKICECCEPLKHSDKEEPPIATVTYCWNEEVLVDEEIAEEQEPSTSEKGRSVN